MIGLFFRRLVSHIRHNTPMGFDDEDLWYFNLIRRNLMLSEEVKGVHFYNTVESGFLEIRVIGKDGVVLVREFCHYFPQFDESFAGLRIYDSLECKLLNKLKSYK